MASNVSDKIIKLVTKTSPQQIYSYRTSKLLHYGSWCLAVTFFTYGISFADWSISSIRMLNKEIEEKQDDKTTSWSENPNFLLFSRGIVAGLMTALPIIATASVYYVRSRVVNSLKYIPGKQPKCQVTRTTMFNTEINDIVDLKSLKRKQNTKIFTGVGKNGAEDKSSFYFLLMDTSKSLLKGIYIVSRSGEFWKNEPRVLDIMLGRDSMKDLQCRIVKPIGKNTQDSAYIDELIKKNSNKIKLQGLNTKNIVMNKSSSLS